MSSLLDGVLVLDFSHWIAGPYAGMLLADMGAEVIKIEPPEGAEERRTGRKERYRGNTRLSLTLNRGKKGLCVDLKQAEGKKIVHQLAARADIVIQNYAPGVAQRLGIDYDTLSGINDQLIFVSSTAFGESGPYQTRKGFDIIAHAASGVMAGYADELGNPRGPGGIPYIDIGTAMLNAVSAIAALYHRSQTGEGQKIETSLFNTGMALQAPGFIKIEKLDSELHEAMREVLDTSLDNEMTHTQIFDRFAEMGLRNEQPESQRDIEVPDCRHRPSDRHTAPYYRIYQVKDGFVSIAALAVRQRISLCRALGVEDRYAHIDLGEGNDETYFHRKEVMKKMEQRFSAKRRDEWIEILEAEGVPCGPVNYAVDLYEDPHALDMNMVWSLENPVSGPYRMAGNPMKFTKTPIEPTKGAPALGENTSLILRTLGYGADEIQELVDQSVVKRSTVSGRGRS